MARHCSGEPICSFFQLDQDVGMVAGGGEWEGNTYVQYIFTAKGLTSNYLGRSTIRTKI